MCRSSPYRVEARATTSCRRKGRTSMFGYKMKLTSVLGTAFAAALSLGFAGRAAAGRPEGLRVAAVAKLAPRLDPAPGPAVTGRADRHPPADLHLRRPRSGGPGPGHDHDPRPGRDAPHLPGRGVGRRSAAGGIGSECPGVRLRPGRGRRGAVLPGREPLAARLGAGPVVACAEPAAAGGGAAGSWQQPFRRALPDERERRE